MVLAVLAWSAGCATAPRPAIEPAFAARTYTPLRITLLPPDIYMVFDEVGANDPAKSEQLRQAVYQQTVTFVTQALRERGYDVDLSVRWDGIVSSTGQLLVNQQELSTLAEGILSFGRGPAAQQQGPLSSVEIVAPELAAKVGWATQSDALLYMNLKGVASSPGKRAAQVAGVLLFVLVIALIVLAVLADSKGGGRGGGSPAVATRGGGAAVAGGPAFRGATPGTVRAPGTGVVTGAAVHPPVGRGYAPSSGYGPRRVYGGGPHIHMGIGVHVPLAGPEYTHGGTVTHEDETFGGDHVYVTMTLVNAADGRVLWHVREDLDVEPDNAKEVERMVHRLVNSIPLRGGLTAPATKPN